MTTSLFKDAAFYSQTFEQINAESKNSIDTQQDRELILLNKTFDNCTFIECDFSQAQFRHCTFVDCVFVRCQLSMVEVSHCKFDEVSFEHCKMLAMDWSKAYWRDLALGAPLSFTGCNLSSNSFYGLSLPKATFNACKLHDVDFREANLAQASFNGSDLLLSLFSNTDLSKASFEQASNYDINLSVNKIKGAVFNRAEAVNLLSSLGIELVD